MSYPVAGNPVGGPGSNGAAGAPAQPRMQVQVIDSNTPVQNNGQPHPTVPYGSMQQQQPPAYNQPQPGQLPPYVPPNNNDTLGGYNLPPVQPPQGTFPQQGGYQQQPNLPQPPQYGAPQGYGQPPQVQRANLTDDIILDGEGVPPELRGRSFGQVKQIYQALSTDWMSRNPAPGAQQPSVQQPNVPTGGREPGSNQEDLDFWGSPGDFIRRELDQRLAPMMRQTHGQAVAQARQIAASGSSDFAQIEGEVMQILNTVDPSMHADPQVWANAVDMARGRMYSRTGQIPQGQPQAMQAGGNQPWSRTNQFGQQVAPQPYRGPGGSVPANGNPPPMHQFYTESPTPPAIQSGVLDQTQRDYARKMGMSEQDYLAWARAATYER